MATELIAPGTAAGVSAAFTLAVGENTKISTGFGIMRAGEEVYLEQQVDGFTWQRVREAPSHGTLCNINRNGARVLGPGQYRVGKTVTAGVVGVYRE